MKSNIRSIISTIMGYLVAIALFLKTVDFSNFTFAKDWDKIIFPLIIILGGHSTQLLGKEDDKNKKSDKV